VHIRAWLVFAALDQLNRQMTKFTVPVNACLWLTRVGIRLHSNLLGGLRSTMRGSGTAQQFVQSTAQFFLS
jgi:hypothetical protein